MARKLEIEIIGDDSSFRRALGRSDSASSKFGRTLGGLGKAGVLAAGAAGVGALFVTLKAGISEFSQASKVAAQTEAVLKSTGGAANVTAEQVDDLASSIMRYSGIDDEAVKSGENLLLTFTGIRNEVGKGNDIFNQATAIMTDMSVALGQDMKSSAIQLGKALNDPIRGMTALRRVGVSFTDAQTEQVKALLASGKTLEAQKLILRELNKEFGGSAKAAGDTLPGQINKLKETFNNLAGDLVSKAVPAVTSFVTFLNEKGLPVIEDVFGKISSAVGPALSKFGEAFKELGPIVSGVLEPLGKVVRENIVPVFEQLQDIGVRAMSAIGDIVRQNGPQIRQIFENLGTVISNLAKVIVPLLEFAFTKVLPVAIRVLIPVLQLVTEVLARVSTAVRIVANVIEAVMIPAMSLILSVGGSVVSFLTKAFTSALDAVLAPLKLVASVLRSVLSPAFDAVTKSAESVRGVFTWFKSEAGPIWRRLGAVLIPVIDAITAAIRALADALRAVASYIGDVINQAGRLADALGSITGALGKIGGVVGKIPGLQHGGVAEKGRAYVVGEHGPELFVPGVTGTVLPSFTEPRQASLSAGPISGRAAPSVTLNVGGSVVSERDLVTMIRNALIQEGRRNGGNILGGYA